MIRTIALFGLALVGSCVDLKSEFRCDADIDCASSKGQGWCEVDKHCSFADLRCSDPARRYATYSGAYSSRCVGALRLDGSISDGAGVDVLDCTPCSSNDKPDRAIFLDGDGEFRGTVSSASDDRLSSCTGIGRKDVFYQFDVKVDEVVYVDTLDEGSETGFDLTLSVFEGRCDALSVELGCSHGGCPEFSQLVLPLTQGTYCLMVEQEESGPIGPFVGRIRHGGRLGRRVPLGSSGQVGNTCDEDNRSEPTKCSPARGARDESFYVTTCRKSLNVVASTCAGTMFDSMVYVRKFSGIAPDEICDSDGCGAGASFSRTLVGAGMYWITVDGETSSQCGDFALALDFF